MMLKFGESGHPVFRATSPLSRGMLKSKGKGKLSIHYCADHETIETVFRTIVSVNQLSLYGAVSKMCEEYESYHNKTWRPVVEGEFDPYSLCFAPHFDEMRSCNCVSSCCAAACSSATCPICV